MKTCDSTIGGSCVRPATMEQTVRAGKRADGPIMMRSYWCDEHAERIAAKRRTDWQPPAEMAPVVPETESV